MTTFRAVVSKALLVEMGLNEAQVDRDNNQKKRGLGKESKALAFKLRNKEHNVLIPRHCQSALDVVGLMQIRIATRILEHVSHVDKGVTGLLSVPNERRFRPPQALQ